MKASRLAAWIFGAAVCGAWLASAAGVPRPAPSMRTQRAGPADVNLKALAGDVQAQADRLRHRIAAAPVPQAPDRNPFSFPVRPRRVRAASVPMMPAPVAPAPPAPVEPFEPVIDLIGVAETREGDALVRTAMLTGAGQELMMATVGQRILGRYEVTAVSPDAVELKDLLTSASRRLVLR